MTQSEEGPHGLCGPYPREETLLERIELATCSYSEFTPDMGAAVRFTVSGPRWKLGYELIGQAHLITPTRAMLAMDKGAYRQAYERRLSQTGTVRIAAELAGLATRAPGQRLILLCFEKLAKGPQVWCHRSMFAVWWEEQTGQEVPELGAVPPPPAPPEPPPLMLF